MSAFPIFKLTERDALQARKGCFEDSREDYLLMLEVLGESEEWHKAYVSHDAIAMVSALDKALWIYLEKIGSFQTAESEYLGMKEREGIYER